MNDDWDEMNEEVRRLDETRMLDTSNFKARGLLGAPELAPPLMQAESKPLQESLLMTFGDEAEANDANFRP